jgi:hypothetical protein
MYTGGVRLRWFAFVVALIVAATPMVGALCAMDCNHPRAVTSHCHDVAPADESVTFRAVPHACNHDHTAMNPALLSGVSGRPLSAPLSGAAPMPSHWMVHALGSLRATPMDGPPGPIGYGTPFPIAVLRI